MTIDTSDAFRDLDKLSREQFQDSMLAGALTLEKYVKINMSQGWPAVRTGNLRSNQESVKTPRGAELHVNADYAAFIEWGTIHISPRAPIRRALDQHEQDILNAILAQVQQTINKDI